MRGKDLCGLCAALGANRELSEHLDVYTQKQHYTL